MKEPEDEDVSLFRFKLIAPLLSLEREPKGEQADYTRHPGHAR